jgi:hypothetical protein
MLAGFLERRGINKYQENLKQQSAVTHPPKKRKKTTERKKRQKGEELNQLQGTCHHVPGWLQRQCTQDPCQERCNNCWTAKTSTRSLD